MNNNNDSVIGEFLKDFKKDFKNKIAHFLVTKVKLGEDLRRYKGRSKPYIKEIYASTENSDLLSKEDEKHYVAIGVEFTEKAIDRLLRKQERESFAPAGVSKTRAAFAKRSFLRNAITGKTKKSHSPRRNSSTHKTHTNTNTSAKIASTTLRKAGINMSDLASALNDI
jgi:hypothetical protein